MLLRLFAVLCVCEYVRDKYVYGFFGVCFCGSLRFCVFVGVYVTCLCFFSCVLMRFFVVVCVCVSAYECVRDKYV